jgi:hypothetical protein
LARSSPRPKNINARRGQHSESRFTPDQFDIQLRWSQKWLIIIVAFVVPLVVLPESNFVDITSVPKTSILRILGSLQAGVLLSRLILRLTTGNNDPRQTIRVMLEPIRVSKPAILILGSIAAVVIVSLISTFFAILPHQSWRGRNPSGFEAGEFTALMYVIMGISAFITLRESRNSAILWQTLAITGVAANLVGFLHFLTLTSRYFRHSRLANHRHKRQPDFLWCHVDNACYDHRWRSIPTIFE